MTREETLTRQIKIYCPQHQTTFEIAESPKIVCEIREHALSNNFPNAEFWEYCCDCRTYFPSDLEVGGKAKTACPQCERTTHRRFVCGECKIVAYDSGEDTKGKIFHLNSENFAVAPACPGCLKVFSEVKPHLHKCEETQTVLSTPRKICPFCKKGTVKAKQKPQTETPRLIKCPNCRANNEADSFFCNDCGEELRSNPQLAKRGTSTAKTQLLGSICPNCGVGNPPDGDFCVNCGQALKAENANPQREAVLQSFPSSLPTQILNPIAAGGVNASAKTKSGNANGFLAAVGIVFGAIFLCVIFQGIISKENSTTSATNSNFNSSPNKANNSYAANLPMMNSNAEISNSSLPTSFSRDYAGTIGGRSFRMSLTRDGSELRGTASTNKTDSVHGTIDSDGSFRLDGYEGGDNLTGKYVGYIYSDGSINGTWTNLQGRQGTSFSLSEE